MKTDVTKLIQDKIVDNNSKQITGSVLQEVLLSMLYDVESTVSLGSGTILDGYTVTSTVTNLAETIETLDTPLYLIQVIVTTTVSVTNFVPQYLTVTPKTPSAVMSSLKLNIVRTTINRTTRQTVFEFSGMTGTPIGTNVIYVMHVM